MSLTRCRFAGRLAGLLAAGSLLASAGTARAPRAGDAPQTPAAADSLPVAFAFAPPAGAYIQRELFVETAKVGGIQKRISLASESSLQVSQEGGRAFLLYRVHRAAAARDGKPSDAAMVAAMTGGETVHIVRPDGVLARIDGLRRFTERLLPTLQGEERSALEKRLRENRLEDRTRSNWFENAEILAGQTLELGRDYFFDSAWPTDHGWIRHQTLLRLGPWEKTPHGRRLRLQLAYVADARSEVPGAVRLQPKVATAWNPVAPGKPAKGFTISGNASRLVDPATLLVWKDQSVRRVRNRLEVSEEMALTISSEEKSDITLEPAASATLPPSANH